LPGFTGEERVRFLGVNTPETYPVEDPWGPEAKVYTTTILTYAKTNGKSIYIQSDANLSYNDTYGRHLGLVWVDLGEDVINIDIVDSSDNLIYTETLTGVILLNYHLVKNGFSYNYYSTDSELVFDNRYLYRWFQDAEKFAKENNLGVHE
jgi:endonuclease YncB( thermonuclease family)